MHETNGISLVVLGLLLLGGYVAHFASRRVSIPKVTILLVIGALCGPSLFDIVPQRIVDWFPFISMLALSMVGFLLGESFAGKHLKETGRVAFTVSITKALAGAVAVTLVVRLAGGSWTMALLLGGIAPATAPAAIVETVRETGSKGPLTNTVLEVVAIDDAWGVILFSILLVAAQATSGESAAGLAEIGSGVWEVAGALLLGGVLGLPMAWLTGRIRGGEMTLVEASGFVFLCAGLAQVIGVSYLLACMALGTMVANRAKESSRPFHEIDHVREPFLAIFFLLAGFRFDVQTLTVLGAIGLAYVLTRSGAFFAGTWAAARWSHADEVVRRRAGWCLLPQAGVAMGLALLAKQEVPEAGEQILPLIIATTILFEVTGPLLLRWQLARADEIGRAEKDDGD